MLTDLEKLEYIHATLQEIPDQNIDYSMVEQALAFVEDIREPHLSIGQESM